MSAILLLSVLIAPALFVMMISSFSNEPDTVEQKQQPIPENIVKEQPKEKYDEPYIQKFEEYPIKLKDNTMYSKWYNKGRNTKPAYGGSMSSSSSSYSSSSNKSSGLYEFPSFTESSSKRSSSYVNESSDDGGWGCNCGWGGDSDCGDGDSD